MLAAALFGTITLVTGVLTFPHDLQYAATESAHDPFGQYQYLVLLVRQSSPATYSAEEIVGGNGLDFNFGGHQSFAPQTVHPPRPSFPSHLEGIQSNHPQGNDYWNNLQGDHDQCPAINSCPAKYGCFVRQKPGGRCPYCKCESRTPNKLHER